MPQIFHHSTNTISRLSIYGAVFIIAILGGVLYCIELSPFYTRVNEAREQPVPFSHKHHAGELGIDCRYCHTGREIIVRGDSTYANVHDLPLANLDQRTDARAGARQLPRR
jgi:hypothetical protein